MAPYGWATGNISIAKANTSVMFNQTTDAVAQWASSIPGFASSLSAMTDGKFIMAAGGWPIRLNGVTIGGIGVSGGNAPGRDDDIARAGLSILAPVPQPVPVYTPPANQVAPTPVPDYNNRSGEYPAVVPTPSNSFHANLTEDTTNTNYLSDQERGVSLEKPPSSNADLQQNSGDQS
jgi:Haem-degrading